MTVCASSGPARKPTARRGPASDRDDHPGSLRRCDFGLIVAPEDEPRRELLFTATDGTHHRIAVDDICYIESMRHRIDLHTLDTVFSIATTVKAMESELSDKGFLRCHSGLLVNLRHVTGIEGNDCRIRGGGRLPISRPRKREFLAALAEHIGSRGISA